MYISELSSHYVDYKTDRYKQHIQDALSTTDSSSYAHRYYLKQYQFEVYEGDLWVDEDLEMEAQALLVTGNLTITGNYIDNSSGALIVLGDMRCHHMIADGGLYVQKNLICGGLCYQHYNDWSFEVKGDFYARLYIPDDKACSLNKVRSDYQYEDMSYDGNTKLNYFSCFDLIGFRKRMGREIDPENNDDDHDDYLDLCGSTECLVHLKECKAAKQDLFAVPLPSLEELSERWGEHHAWLKILWYPYTQSITEQDCQTLIQQDPGWALELILSKHLPSSMFSELLSSNEQALRWAMACSSDCPKECLRVLATDANVKVREAALSNRNCPEV